MAPIRGYLPGTAHTVSVGTGWVKSVERVSPLADPCPSEHRKIGAGGIRGRPAVPCVWEIRGRVLYDNHMGIPVLEIAQWAAAYSTTDACTSPDLYGQAKPRTSRSASAAPRSPATVEKRTKHSVCLPIAENTFAEGGAGIFSARLGYTTRNFCHAISRACITRSIYTTVVTDRAYRTPSRFCQYSSPVCQKTGAGPPRHTAGAFRAVCNCLYGSWIPAPVSSTGQAARE